MSSWDTLMAAGQLAPGVEIGALTTYKLGGPAAWYAEIHSPIELSSLAEDAAARGLEILIVGRGSNMVVADSGFDGLVVRLAGSFRDVGVEGGAVTAGAALSLPVLARTVAHAGLAGLEFYVGIPGTVGGAVVMNAEFHGGETAEVLANATVMDLRTGALGARSNAELDFGYRTSSIGLLDVVIDATFQLVAGSIEGSLARMREVTQWRKDRQPGGTFNAGSVFRNPSEDHAGRIIDELGLKGFTIRGASVSHRHANFFVAGSDATAQDVYDLVHAVRRLVFDSTGVLLEPEIRFHGIFRPSPDEIS